MWECPSDISLVCVAYVAHHVGSCVKMKTYDICRYPYNCCRYLLDYRIIVYIVSICKPDCNDTQYTLTIVHVHTMLIMIEIKHDYFDKPL